MTDYWLSKLFFDLQKPELAAAYARDRDAVLGAYPLAPEALAALAADDVAGLAARVNAYLLRYYFGAIGMPDAAFVDAVRALG